MIRIALLLLALAPPALAQPARPQPLMPLHEAVKIVAGRFDGRLLAARLDQPRPYEFALGAEVVQEMTLLSPQGNILLFRLDAVTGKVLEVRGRGLTKARKGNGSMEKERD
ncbi:PepSY domain-containing protein [Paracoccus xiamenensis]|uniref:PepSY domain-containing protein n=1 Tax=Paracoccus xiamenensis TaxID=2714901 RepID=UPI00140D3160|nr:hypothetical protein [Paracoccus xiamenensis]NHF72611.1 hypothetical protein [Paracoccus xiamenensis]